MYAGASDISDSNDVKVIVQLTGCGVSGCSLVAAEAPPGVDPAATATWAIQTNDAAASWWPAVASLTPDRQGVILTARSEIKPRASLRALASSYGDYNVLLFRSHVFALNFKWQ